MNLTRSSPAVLNNTVTDLSKFPSPLRIAVVLLLILLSVACGKKGPLQLPEDVRPMEISDLRAASLEGETILSWSKPRKNADGSRFRDLAGFLIMRAEEDAGTFRKMHFMELEGQDIRNGQVSWTDSETEDGRTYHYLVYSRNSLKVYSLPSNTATVRAMPNLPAPSGISGEGGDGYALVSWLPVDGASGYHVYRATRPEGPYEKVTDGVQAGQEFRDRIPNTQAFHYQVRAVGEGDSLGKASASVRVAPRRTNPPDPVTGLKGGYAAGTVYLTWEPVKDTSSFGAYEVCRVTDPVRPCRRTIQPSFADRDPGQVGEIRYEVRVIDNSASPVMSRISGVAVEVPAP